MRALLPIIYFPSLILSLSSYACSLPIVGTHAPDVLESTVRELEDETNLRGSPLMISPNESANAKEK